MTTRETTAKKITSISIAPKVKEQAQGYARELGISLSSLITISLLDFMSKKEERVRTSKE